MRRNIRQYTLVFLPLLCISILAACNNSAPVLRFVTVAPTSATISVAATQQFTATVFYSDGSQKDGTNLVTWGISSAGAANVATITAGGLATGVTTGVATITASLGGASGSATLTVQSNFTSLTVACAPASIPLALTSACTATGNPGNVNLTTQVTWNSSNTAVATIASTGVAQSTGAGSTNISATFSALPSNNFALTVTAAVADGLTLAPASPTAAVGNTVAFTATEHFTDGTSGHPLTGTVTWASATPTVASIGATNGIALSLAAGTSVITATESGTNCPGATACTGTATLTVVAAVARYAYTGNINDFNISGFGVTASTATLTSLAASTGNPWAASSPQQVIAHPSGKYVYCICTTTATVTSAIVFDIDSTTGSLTAPSTTAGAGTAFSVPVGTGGYNKGAIDPTGQFLYVLDNSGDTVAGFAITQSDGSLSTTAVNSLTTGDSPVDILVARNATGTYLYVVNAGLGLVSSQASVSAYSIDSSTGALTALNSGTPFANGVTDVTSPANYGAVDPSNTHLYVTNGAPDNSVTVFSIPGTGLLSPIASSPFAITGTPTPTFLISVAVDPTDKYIYVVDTPASPTNGNVYAYNILAGGGLSAAPAIAGSPYQIGDSPIGISIDPSGTFLAVVNNDDLLTTISQFKLAPSTGVLTPASPATATAGNDALYLTFWVGP